MKDSKATLYVKNDFGAIVKIECHLNEIAKRKWAQYNNAISVSFKRKRARRNSEIILSYKPYLVAVEGWDRPDAPSMYGEPEVQNGVIVRRSKYASFDAGYCKDFDEIVDSGKLGNVIFEARHTRGVSCY